MVKVFKGAVKNELEETVVQQEMASYLQLDNINFLIGAGCSSPVSYTHLRYAYSRYKMVEEEILKDRPVRNGRKMPVEAKIGRASCRERV